MAPSVSVLTASVNPLTGIADTVCVMPRSLAERARAARLRAGFRHPQEAADAIGCSRPLVVSWEDGKAKSIGSRYLLAAAEAYRVRPDWLTLESDVDGFPWQPLNDSSKRGKGALVTPTSQFARPDPATLHEAVTLLLFDLDHGGPRSARTATAMLLDLYDRIAAAGGQLPEAEQVAFEEQARLRGQKGIVKHERVEQRRHRTSPGKQR